MTIMTLKTFGELKGKIAKPMTYFKFDKPFSFAIFITMLLDA